MGNLILLLAALARPALAGLPDIDTPLKTGASAPADTAVVIGIEDYAFAPDVPFARRDAAAVYDLLVYTRGVPASRVRLLNNGASKEQILAAVTEAGKGVGAGGTVWVYFAGHGAANSSTGARMLLGDDVRPDPVAFDARGVTVDELTKLAGAGGGSVNLILDACYSGLGRGGEELLAGKRFLVPAYAQTSSPAVLEWDAASGDELSGPLAGAQHGAFTYFAVGALRGWADGARDGQRDGVVTAEEAQLYVREGLRAAQITTQNPQMTVSKAGERALMKGAGLEAAPKIDANSAAVPSGGGAVVLAPGAPVALSDRRAVEATVKQLVRGCVDEHAPGDVRLARWVVRFKYVPGKGLKSVMATPPVDSGYQPDAAGSAVWSCVRNGLKAQAWTGSATTTFQTTVTLEDLAKAATAAKAAAETGLVKLIFRPSTTDWFDVWVDGAKAGERRALDEVLELRVTPGQHTVELRAFMSDEPFARGRVDTGGALELIYGVKPGQAVEPLNNDSWSPQ